MKLDFDVMIVGGGVVGLSAAIAMRQRAFSVAIVDAGSLSPDVSSPNARVYAFNQASQRLLDRLGVWSRILPTQISLYQHMHVWDGVSGSHIDFDARTMGADRLGVILDESVLKHALLEEATALGVELLSDHRVNAVQASADGVSLQTQTAHWRTRLLIVADGAQSKTRALLGVPITTWPYHQDAIVARIETEQSHQHTAYQVFTPDGPLAFLPLMNTHHSSIVWSTSRAKTLMALSEKAFADALAQAFESTLGACHLISARHAFPLHMRHADRYSGPGWLLMGDAAHTIHPLAGLGLNVGLADLEAWLSLFDAHAKKAGPHSMPWSSQALGAYQRQRKHAVWKTIALMGGLKTLFANPLPPIVALRGFGLSVFNHWPALKRLCIEHAAGE